MASDIPPILIDVQVEMGRVKSQLDQLQSEIKQVGDAAKGQESKVGGLENKLGKLASGFKKIVGAAAVVSVFTASAKAAAEDAQSIALLNKQLELSVGATEGQKEAVDASIQAMSDATGIVDDKIRPSFAALVRATGDVAQAQTLTTLALDAAAAKGKDAEAVASALAKAHNGNTRQLAMLFPELKNSKDMMADLAAETKGMAEAAADANPMMRLTVQFDRLKETLGAAVMPLLSQLVPVFEKLMPLIETVAGVVNKLVERIMPFVEVLLDELIPVVEYLLEALYPVVDAILEALMPAFKAIAKVIKPIVEALLPPLIKLLDKVLVPVLEFLADLIVNYVVPIIEELADGLGNGLTVAVDVMVAAFEGAAAILGPFWNGVLKPLIDGLLGLIGVEVNPKVKPTADTSNLRAAEMGLTGERKIGLDYSGFSSLAVVAGKSPAAKKATAQEDQAKAILKAQQDFQKASLKAQQDYQKAVTDRVTDFKKSFADATKVNVADMFNMGYQSAEALVQALKDKLVETKNFAANIGKLSAANYSEDFIRQVQELGPMMGNMLAEQLLSETPAVQDELKGLFSESQLISNTGVDTVAKNLIPSFTDATTRLGNAMVDAANGLDKALTKIANLTPAQIQKATTGAYQQTQQQSAANSKPPIIVNTNVAGSSSSASEIAASIVSAIKFNSTYTLQDVTQLSNNLANTAVNNLQASWSNPFSNPFGAMP